MLYFAYGSNMNHEQMEKRCPGGQFKGSAKLGNYKFVYDGYANGWKGAVGNIIPSKGDYVSGGLFEINDDNLAALDCYEGYPESYRRKQIKVRGDDGSFHEALVYLRTGQKVGEPSKEYRRGVIAGAKDCGLPQDYIDSNL